MTTPDTDPSLEFVTALARGLSVLRALNDAPQPLTLSETAQRVGLPRAAVRRSLHTLQQTGYVHSDGRTYTPTTETLHLGAAHLIRQPFAVAAQPVLRDLSTQTGESCSVAVLNGAVITYVARVSTSRIMSINLQVGTQLPAFCTSMGRVLLAHLDSDDLERVLSSTPLTARTPLTITDQTVLRTELQRVREHGYAVIDQELELGLRSVAVPITAADGSVLAALNIGANAASRSMDDLRSLVPALHAAARRLSVLDAAGT